MSLPEIGSIIGVISRSNIRYEGRLFSINPDTLSVSLRNVRLFGTEGRDAQLPIGPVDRIYDFIVFKRSDIKDIRVANPPTFPEQAVLEARVAGEKHLMSDFAQKYRNSPRPKSGNPVGYGNNFAMDALGMGSFGMLNLGMGRSEAYGGCGARDTGAADLCDLFSNQQQPFQHPRVNEQGNHSRGCSHQQHNRRGFPNCNNQRGCGGSGPNRAWLTYRNPNNLNKIPQFGRMPNPDSLPMAGQTNTDFDFEEGNSKFEELRYELAELKVKDGAKPNHQTDGKSEEKVVCEYEPGTDEHEAQQKESKGGYDKSKSFFDSISSDATEDRNADRPRRKVNRETFGSDFKTMGNYRNRRGGHDRYYHK